jgi:hypothetical protein
MRPKSPSLNVFATGNQAAYALISSFRMSLKRDAVPIAKPPSSKYGLNKYVGKATISQSK